MGFLVGANGGITHKKIDRGFNTLSTLALAAVRSAGPLRKLLRATSLIRARSQQGLGRSRRVSIVDGQRSST
jgi:hypothetical protein